MNFLKKNFTSHFRCEKRKNKHHKIQVRIIWNRAWHSPKKKKSKFLFIFHILEYLFMSLQIQRKHNLLFTLATIIFVLAVVVIVAQPAHRKRKKINKISIQPRSILNSHALMYTIKSNCVRNQMFNSLKNEDTHARTNVQTRCLFLSTNFPKNWSCINARRRLPRSKTNYGCFYSSVGCFFTHSFRRNMRITHN
jgi:hypothetical protein